MQTPAELLREYLQTTPREELLAQWEQVRDICPKGPTLSDVLLGSEYLHEVRHAGHVYLLTDAEISSLLAPYQEQPADAPLVRVKPESYSNRYEELAAQHQVETDPARKAELKQRMERVKANEIKAMLAKADELSTTQPQ